MDEYTNEEIIIIDDFRVIPRNCELLIPLDPYHSAPAEYQISLFSIAT